MDDLSPECREVLLGISDLVTSETWVSINDFSESVVGQLVRRGLLEYRCGSRQMQSRPGSVVVTYAGRQLAEKLRSGAVIDQAPNRPAALD